jgi:hypothetical protein
MGSLPSATGSLLPSADFMRLTGAGAINMTSESWAQVSARASILAAQLRELENMGQSHPSPSTSTQPSSSMAADNLQRPADPTQPGAATAHWNPPNTSAHAKRDPALAMSSSSSGLAPYIPVDFAPAFPDMPRPGPWSAGPAPAGVGGDGFAAWMASGGGRCGPGWDPFRFAQLPVFHGRGAGMAPGLPSAGGLVAGATAGDGSKGAGRGRRRTAAATTARRQVGGMEGGGNKNRGSGRGSEV